ncbi:FAD-dependent oxidoreductase [Mucilaginibacter sp.]|uniref:FAD-dependent oxidoreductase n=1 Tax=Mucilaginibacter sp. TaxID=1882438 RepID=UPI0035BBD779
MLLNQKIAVIGAGPVGLTVANLLQKKGIDVTVYERDKDAKERIWGGTLDLHEHSGQKALKAAGLLDSYFEKGKPMGRKIVNELGELLQVIPPDYSSPEINRNQLRTILLHNLAIDTVIWDIKLTGLEVHNQKWVLSFDNQPDATADVVIVANGGRSKVSHYVTDAKVQDTGTFILQGEVIDPEINCPDFHRLCDNKLLMSAYGGNLLGAHPDNNGQLTYNVIFEQTEEWEEQEIDLHNNDKVIAYLTDRFAGWANCYKQLFLATTTFWGLPTKKLPLAHAWKNNRPLPVTLIGDAAHLMPPFAGQGVNTGLLDALVLSDNLTGGDFDTVENAISDYEQKMMIYAGAAQLETDKNEKALRQPGYSFANRFKS